ncbi:increased loss of mitochondrial DNA protein 1 [Colletotrichum phormii]|uniref:Increased loss of mitochondrial DNA protein 1 n=1 Tax=Colletotrichum phormii TaxID=359342 RepID=A0AAI9ZSK8_9PEZI|nr:increased loss of mitochondrial DNA protein 1 [Colletotrichum phormii]KAK1637445.1 increased loss of mitochondrial DNA protein 1 [Colletotrichum phormii]
MAIISAKTIITSLSLFHVTLAYFFLTNPATIADQAMVYVLGESMGMPHARSFENRSPALAFLAAVLGILGISDLVTLSMPEEVWLIYHWGTQAPTRMVMSFGFVLYIFLFGPSSPLYGGTSKGGSRFAHPSVQSNNPRYTPSTWGGDGLKNRVFLTFAFLEMLCWFWVWMTLREEQEEFQRKNQHKRRGSQSGYN